MISSAMGETKAANAEASGAEYVTSTDPSCLMHIEGVLRLRKSPVRTIHLASILAQTGSPATAENISRDAAAVDGAR
jgi:L-lactate dehydrogenase complex protein LldE